MNYVLMPLAALLLLVALGLGWTLTVFGLPGNWVMVGSTALYALVVPPEWRIDVSWMVVGAVALLAGVGELLELLAGAWSTTRAGGSRRAAVLALGGSVIGGILGALVGIPVPVIGSILAVLLFAGAGATAGAMLGEAWKGRTVEEGWQVGKAAFWGRLLGTLGKVLAGSVIVVVVVLALVL